MRDLRVGRFQAHGWTEPQHGEPHADIYSDHANGAVREYKFPNLSERDLRDLQYMVRSLLRDIDERKIADRRRQQT